MNIPAPVPVTRKDCKDFGLVLIVVLLVFNRHRKLPVVEEIEILLGLVTLLIPLLLYPVALVWFSLSKILGQLGPMLMLGLVFFLIVWPAGLISRLSGRDLLKLKEFKKDSSSVLAVVNHTCTGEDLQHLF